ncbi:hypothetical protein [Paenibacillus silvae]|uniref:hypothetical protein n=1 Tax=Paenibacillus silvae TaxID=1325358 RepID=UPI0011B3B81B|nr:hypothetical protein [Paenibacillus silvae]
MGSMDVIDGMGGMEIIGGMGDMGDMDDMGDMGGMMYVCFKHFQKNTGCSACHYICKIITRPAASTG